MLLVFELEPADLSLKPTCLEVWTVILLRVWSVLWVCLLCAYAKPGVELRKARPDKIITPLPSRDLRDAFLFTPQLSNIVGMRFNKYAVLQQIEFNRDQAQS